MQNNGRDNVQNKKRNYFANAEARANSNAVAGKHASAVHDGAPNHDANAGAGRGGDHIRHTRRGHAWATIVTAQ